jgi:hypothetical protein
VNPITGRLLRTFDSLKNKFGPIWMSHWRHTMVDGVEFWISWQWLRLLRKPSHWQVHRGTFCQFLFRWIYYCHSYKSTGKETSKTHLYEVIQNSAPSTIVWRQCDIQIAEKFRTIADNFGQVWTTVEIG